MKILETHVIPHGTKSIFLNTYLPKVFPMIPSKERAKKLMDKGLIKVNGAKVSKAYIGRPGDKIDFYGLSPASKKVYEEQLDVVYEDEYMAVVFKPGGLPVNGNTFKTLENALPYNLKLSLQEDRLPAPLPVHRLDVPTCGLVMVAKTAQAQVALGKMLQDKQLEKQYKAVVIGALQKKEGVIDEPIQGKPSKTKYKVLEDVNSHQYGKLSLLALYPITGRTHQLRIHLSNMGHPIVGDEYYTEKHELFKGKGLFLCAVALKLMHPVTQQPLEIETNPPRKFEKYLERQRIMWERNN